MHIVFAFSEERKLLDDERVLFVQLNWGKDVREGRFLLRKEVSAGQVPELYVYRKSVYLKIIIEPRHDFQHCGILTSVLDSDKPWQPPFKLRNSK